MCGQGAEIVIKPSLDTSVGKNINVPQNTGNCNFEKELYDVIDNFTKRGIKNWVVQDYFKQHERLAALNPDSVNTIRIYSLLWQGKVHILKKLVRIGTKGVRVDNLVASHGVACNINDSGCFDATGTDYSGNKTTILPSGVVLKDYAIPSFDKVVDFVRVQHCRLAHFKLVGWDLSVDQDGNPFVIEINLCTPCCLLGQIASGPMLGDGELFNDVLDYVFFKR